MPALNNIKTTFKKILLLEQSLNYSDSAVIGGIDAFITKNNTSLIDLTDGNNDITYKSLNHPQRIEWISQTLSKLNPDAHKSIDNYLLPLVTPSLKVTDSIQKVPGLKRRNVASKIENHLAIKTVKDLIYHFPSYHEDFTEIRKINQLVEEIPQSCVAIVKNSPKTSKFNRTNIRTTVVLGDDTGTFSMTLFNQPWAAENLKPGTKIIVSGKPTITKGKVSFNNSDYEIVKSKMESIHTGRLVPTHPLTEGISKKSMRRAIYHALAASAPKIKDFIPSEIKQKLGLISLNHALTRYHFPRNQKEFQKAKRRLAFDELFTLQLFLQKDRQDWRTGLNSTPLIAKENGLRSFLDSLPFKLTKSQNTAINEIITDINKESPMRRLLQGDVGSGKTVVAVSAIAIAIQNRYQSAFMAPTEILAEQHFSTVLNLLGSNEAETTLDGHLIKTKMKGVNENITIALLIGNMPEKNKKEIRHRLKSGEIDLIIGTHSLIQEAVSIPKLALAIIDEEQRFGVKQRNTLFRGLSRPHLLEMSATPIPRSLSLILFDQVDISILDEKPSGRKAIQTILETSRNRVYAFIKAQILDGRQAFMVYPLIDDSEAISVRSATSEYERLRNSFFQDFRIGLIHGKMTLKEKEHIMDQFRLGIIQILISTAVIEVGVDIPNASVMYIDGADRFGLSQLHQFRGRVGRGIHESFCILYTDNNSKESKTRMHILRQNADGFKLAEEDLKLRGIGKTLGTEQSGHNLFSVASVSDTDLIRLASSEAKSIVQTDPELTLPEHKAIRKKYLDSLNQFQIA